MLADCHLLQQDAGWAGTVSRAWMSVAVPRDLRPLALVCGHSEIKLA